MHTHCPQAHRARYATPGEVVQRVAGLACLAGLIGITKWDGTSTAEEVTTLAQTGEPVQTPPAEQTIAPGTAEPVIPPEPVTKLITGTVVQSEPAPEPTTQTQPTSEVEPIPEPQTEPNPDLPFDGVYFNPPSQQVKCGKEIIVNVETKIADFGISAAEITLEFDPAALQVIGLTSGELLGNGPLIGTEEKDNQRGVIHYALARKGPTQVTDSAGVLAVIKFKVVGSAGDQHNLTLSEVKLTNQDFKTISGFEIHNGSVEITR